MDKLGNDKKYKVLIVDDSLYMRKKLKAIVEKGNFEVAAEASSGKDAIDVFKTNKELEIITMDIIMPDMDGIEATKALLEINPDLKIIIISSLGTREKVIDAIKVGAKNFIIKPFQNDKVLNTLNSII